MMNFALQDQWAANVQADPNEDIAGVQRPCCRLVAGGKGGMPCERDFASFVMMHFDRWRGVECRLSTCLDI